MKTGITNPKEATIIFFSIFVLVTILEFYCSYISYESYGAFTPGFLGLVTCINIVAAKFYFLKNTTTAYIILLLVGLYIIPLQLYRQLEHVQLKEESANIVSYVYEHKIWTGKYPENISGYLFTFPYLKENVFYEYNKKDSASFMVRYFVGDAASSVHYYDNSSGHCWRHYDD